MDGQVIKFVLADFIGGWTRTDTGDSISYKPVTVVDLLVVRESASGDLTTYFYAFGPSAGEVLVVDDVIHVPSRFSKAVPGDQITNPSELSQPLHRPVDPGSENLP